MRIALLHGWRLSGSGSNEYNRYLARSLAAAGHEVHVLCREPDPERVEFVDRAFAWNTAGESRLLFERSGGNYVLHQLPHGDVRPVYVTDKLPGGVVKPYISMTDAELLEHRELYTRVVRAVLKKHPVDIVHANHVVLQPTIAADVCGPLGIPFVIYPHGSAIEYTVRRDDRYLRLAGEAIEKSAGLIIGSREVQGRLLELFEESKEKIEASRIVGVGVDTSLFEPVARSERMQSIRKLADLLPGGGKTPALVRDLHEKLAGGELEAVNAYQTAYARTRPDEDCAEHLLRIPWDSGKILLFVGALTVGKGLHRVIAGLPGLFQRLEDTHFVVVGSGAYREALEALVYAISAGNEDLLDKLVSRGYRLTETHLAGPWKSVESHLASTQNRRILLSAGKGFTQRVHFLGRLSHQYLRYLFPCADAAVFPSIVAEAYPLVLMESLANGVLPAASYFSGFAEGMDALIPHLGEEMVDRMRLPTDPSSAVKGIADRLESILSEPAGEDLRSALRRIAVQCYDWSICTEQMLRAYGGFGSKP